MAGALGLVITTDVSVSGQHAQPVYVDDSLPIVGPARACVVVSAGEIPPMGGPAIPVRLAPAGTPAVGPALPVYVVSGSLGASAAAGPAYLLRDTFTDANGTNLSAHTMDVGPGWTLNGTWDIQSNRARNTGSTPGGPDWLATAESGAANGTISVVINIANAATSGICFRYTNTNNLWLAIASPSADKLFIYERNAGVYQLRAQSPGAISPAIDPTTDYTLTLVLNGTNVSLSINGGNTISYASATFNQSATKHGIRSDVSGDKFDDFTMVA